MRKKKHPSTCCPAAKAPKTQQNAVTDMREKPVDCFNGNAWASILAPTNNAKVSAPVVETIIPCSDLVSTLLKISNFFFFRYNAQ